MYPFDGSGGGGFGVTSTSGGFNGFGGTNGQSMSNMSLGNSFGGGMGMGNSGSGFGMSQPTTTTSGSMPPLSWWDMHNARALNTPTNQTQQPGNGGFVPQSAGGSPVPQQHRMGLMSMWNGQHNGWSNPNNPHSMLAPNSTPAFGNTPGAGGPMSPWRSGAGTEMFATNPFAYNRQASAASPSPSSVSASPAMVDPDPTNNYYQANMPIPQQGGYGTLAGMQNGQFPSAPANRYSAVGGDRWWQGSIPTNATIGRLNQPTTGMASGIQTLADKFGWNDPRVAAAANQARQSQWDSWSQIRPAPYAKGGLVSQEERDVSNRLRRRAIELGGGNLADNPPEANAYDYLSGYPLNYEGMRDAFISQRGFAPAGRMDGALRGRLTPAQAMQLERELDQAGREYDLERARENNRFGLGSLR